MQTRPEKRSVRSEVLGPLFLPDLPAVDSSLSFFLLFFSFLFPPKWLCAAPGGSLMGVGHTVLRCNLSGIGVVPAGVKAVCCGSVARLRAEATGPQCLRAKKKLALLPGCFCPFFPVYQFPGQNAGVCFFFSDKTKRFNFKQSVGKTKNNR